MTHSLNDTDEDAGRGLFGALEETPPEEARALFDTTERSAAASVAVGRRLDAPLPLPLDGNAVARIRAKLDQVTWRARVDKPPLSSISPPSRWVANTRPTGGSGASGTKSRGSVLELDHAGAARVPEYGDGHRDTSPVSVRALVAGATLTTTRASLRIGN